MLILRASRQRHFLYLKYNGIGATAILYYLKETETTFRPLGSCWYLEEVNKKYDVDDYLRNGTWKKLKTLFKRQKRLMPPVLTHGTFLRS